MKKTYSLIIGLFVIIGIAVGAYLWITGIFASNYAYRSPLKDNSPTPGAALGDASTGRVVMVLIDALRYDTSTIKEVMPTLNQLRAQGASAVMRSRPPSFSEPGYSSLMTGAWPELSDGPTFNLDYEQIPTWTQDNLFSAAHRAGLKTAVSGYYWFEKLIPQQDVDLHFYTSGEDRLADEQVMAEALPWLKNDAASLVLIHLDQVDYAGHHEGGPKAAAWNEAASRVDAMLAQIALNLDFSKDTLVVFSDHGQIDAGGHGGQEPIVLTEPFVIVGPGVVPGEYPAIKMVDVAPTISAVLGLNLPASSQGEVLTNMLNLPESIKSALPGAVEKQQTALATAYAVSLGMKIDAAKMPTGSNVAQYQNYLDSLRNGRIFVQRVVRAAILAVLLALFVSLLIRNIKNGSLWWIASGLVFSGIFNYRYGVWDQKTYSVSSIISESDLLTYVAITAGAAFLIAWLFSALGKRTFWQKPLDATLSTVGIILTMIFVSALPVFWSFLMNGVLVTWTLPDYLSSFLGLLGLLQILMIAAAGLIAIVITAVISRISQRRPATLRRR